MRKVKFIEPIESIQGKLCGHSKVVFCKGNHNQNNGEQWIQLRHNKRDEDRHPIRETERQRWERFKQVSQAVATRMKSAQRTQDILDMQTQKFVGTLRQYMWEQELAKYDAQQG